MRFRILNAVLILFMLFTICIPGFLADHFNQGNTSRIWVPELSIQSIELTHSTDEPTDAGEYINKTREVVITIENTGSVVLTNLIISYKVMRGTFTDDAGTDSGKNKILITEIYQSKFDWTPIIGEGTKYSIEVSVTADNFGNTYGPISTKADFIINDVKKDVGPVDFYFDPPMASLGGELANRSHNLIVKVKNFGNFQLTSSFTTEATIYSDITQQQLWTDSKIHSTPVAANGVAEISFSTPWIPLNIGMYRLNMSTTLTGDSNPINNNFTPPSILVGDVRDAGITMINNFEHNAIYHCDPLTISARIENMGNVNITTSFFAVLNINSYPAGNNLFAPAPVPVPVTGSNNITEPGKFFNAVFSTWDYSNGLAQGKVWFNVSIDSNDKNGSSYNNNFSIIIELKNWTDAHLEFQTPQVGSYYSEDITEIILKVTNSGTEALPPYLINLTLRNEYSEETWANYTGQEQPGGLAAGSFKILNFPDWDINYNSKFNLTATLAWSSAPDNVLITVSRRFEIKGGEVNGTISGLVYGASEGTGLNNITVRIYLPYQPDPFFTTNTAADGTFQANLEAVPEGRIYYVVISKTDNYWWHEEKRAVEVFSGRETTITMTLTKQLTGRLNGKVLLTSSPGMPEVDPDWSGIKISVEGTHVVFSTDTQGNFDTELVAEVINITASKNNFIKIRQEYVTIIPSQTTQLELTLYEAWSVELSPVNGETEVPTDTPITAIFNSKIDVSSVTPNTFGILDNSGKLLTGLSMDDYLFYKDNTSCRITPPNQLKYNSTYKLKITTKVKLEDGTQALHRNWESKFKTELGEGALEGFCTLYWSKTPLENVKINLSGQVQYNVVTNDNGLYIIESIPAGNYKITVSMNEYSPIIETIEIIPGRILWLNFTFDDGLPVPRVWAKNLVGKKVLIDENLTDRIRVDTELTITSNIPLDPISVNENTVLIIDKSTDKALTYHNIMWSQNRLTFVFEPKNELKYNTTYQIIYKPDILTFDGRQIFQNDWYYGNFTTDEYMWRPLTSPYISPLNGAVNVPINQTVTIDFPVPMNKTTVESLINATFEITFFAWYGNNTTLSILHERFEYFTEYKITLMTGMESEDRFYRLMAPIVVSFTTVSGLVKQVIGPITDQNGKVVEGVGVNIYNSTEHLIDWSVTNSSGFAIFYFDSPLDPGEYTLELIKPGYKVIKWDFSVNETGELVFPGALPAIKKKGEADDTNWWFIGGLIAATILIIILGLAGFLILIRFKPKKIEPEAEGEIGKETKTDLKKGKGPAKPTPELKPSTPTQPTKTEPTTTTPPRTLPGTGKGFSIIEKPKSEDKKSKSEPETESKEEKPASSEQLLDKVKGEAKKD